MDEDLGRFIEHARERGLDFGTIRTLLRAAGWKDQEVSSAFAAQALDLPVPEPPTVGSARDVFFHVLSFTALYTWVISLIVLLFEYVNLALPDPAWSEWHEWREGAYSTIRSALAAIVVAFPLFLVLWRYILRDLARHPEKSKSPVRRGMTYLSLFFGAVTLLTDLITLVYHLFEGELTGRFLLKVAILFVITGGVFVYLAFTLRADQARSS